MTHEEIIHWKNARLCAIIMENDLPLTLRIENQSPYIFQNSCSIVFEERLGHDDYSYE